MIWRVVIALLLLLAGSAFGATRYVAPTGGGVSPFTNWADASTNIQYAVNAALYGDTVLLTDGQYQVSAEITVTSNIIFESVNGRDATTIWADWSVVSTRIINVSAKATGTVIRGITFSNGVAKGVDNGGGAIQTSVPITIEDCRMTYCKAIKSGGSYGYGHFLYSSAPGDSDVRGCDMSYSRSDGTSVRGFVVGNWILSNCVFHHNWSYNNTRGALLYAAGSRSFDCIFASNEANGVDGSLTWGGGHHGVIAHGNVITSGSGFLFYSSAISNAIVRDNTVLGSLFNLSVVSDSNIYQNHKISGVEYGLIGNVAIFTRCKIYANDLSAGALLDCSAINCLFYANTNSISVSGGVVCRTTNVNCTLVMNVCTGSNQGALYGSKSMNALAWSNTTDFRLGSYYGTNWYCLGSGTNFAVNGGTTNDPYLDGSYFPQVGSAAIDAGLTNYNSELVDLALSPRIVGASIDIGCYEWQGATTIPDRNLNYIGALLLIRARGIP